MRTLVLLLTIMALPAWGGERLKQISTADRFPVWGDSAEREAYFANQEEERLEALAEAEARRAEEDAARAEHEARMAVLEAERQAAEAAARRPQIIVQNNNYGPPQGCYLVPVRRWQPPPEITKYPPPGVRPTPKVATEPQTRLVCPGQPIWQVRPRRQGTQLELQVQGGNVSGGVQIVQPGFGLGLGFD